MAEDWGDGCYEVCFNENGVLEGQLLKWKVRPGSRVFQGTVLLLYHEFDSNCDVGEAAAAITAAAKKAEPKKVKASAVGTVRQLLKKEGDLIYEGCGLLTVEGCTHSVVMKDMCAECGADLRESKRDEKQDTASVAMVHSVPELVVSQEQAEILGKADEQRLIMNRKLVLLVDLDQTLVHTTNDDVPSNLKDVHHFQMYGANSQWYHVRLRPGTSQFLEKVSKLYELHICTFGARMYAHIITKLLDKDGRYFSHRILSRDECFNSNSKIANLKALFPCGDQLVCIIDDRKDVWNFSPNLVHVKPYHFFQHTGDINAPPGLTKTERDSGSNYLVGTAKIKIRNTVDSTGAAPGGGSDSEASKNDESVEGESSSSKLSSEVGEIKDDGAAATPEVTDMDVDDGALTNCSTSVAAGDEQRHTAEKDDEGSIPADAPNCSDSAKEPAEAATTTAAAATLAASGTDNGAVIDVEDEDDYLLYLTDILTKIHATFYKLLDGMKEMDVPGVPNLKCIVPQLRKSVLRGANIVFSGMIPTNVPVEKSRGYHVARALGATIQPRLVRPGGGGDKKHATTHVVAARLGTIKVSEARKLPNVSIVTPQWLWCCAERWDRVDERLFPLTKSTTSVEHKGFSSSTNQPQDHPPRSPPNCSRDTETVYEKPVQTCSFATYDPVTGKRVNRFKDRSGNSAAKAGWNKAKNPSAKDAGNWAKGDSNDTTTQPSSVKDAGVPGTSGDTSPSTKDFANTINPFMAFSTQDIADMDREVEDILDGTDSDDNEDRIGDGSVPDSDSEKRAVAEFVLDGTIAESSSDSSRDTLTEDCPRGWGRKRKELDEGMHDSVYPRSKIPRDSDRSSGETSDSDECGESIGSVDEEMAAAVEREFLGM